MTYEYRHVGVVHVVDGDTVKLIVDMGNKIRWTENFRLFGIDTPERGQVNHDEATDYLNKLLSNGVTRIVTYKPDKYGRWLVDIWVAIDGGELHANHAMVVEGFAKEYFGGKKG